MSPLAFIILAMLTGLFWQIANGFEKDDKQGYALLFRTMSAGLAALTLLEGLLLLDYVINP